MFIFNKRGRRKYIHIVFHHFMKQRPCYEINIERNSILSGILLIYISYIYIYRTVVLQHTIYLLNDIFNLSSVECLQSFLEKKLGVLNEIVKRLIVLMTISLHNCLLDVKMQPFWSLQYYDLVVNSKNNFISCKYHNFVRSASRIRAKTSQAFLFRIQTLMAIFYRNRMTLSYPLCFRRLLLLS